VRSLPRMELLPPLVLVADDDDSLREALSEALVSQGFATALAVDGQHALELVADGVAPCLILLDWVMPRMNGKAFLDARARSVHLSSIPVVVVSATHVPLPAGAENQEFLSKPFSLGELLTTVRNVCQSHCPASRRLTRACTRSGTAHVP
jgi:CheY-like chemotaxis protein